MSRFFNQNQSALSPYVPGEQPRDQKYIKLNTNESPYPPAPGVARVLSDPMVAKNLRLYPDPTASAFLAVAAEYFQVPMSYVFAGNGSDEVLAFCFLAFLNRVQYPSISYGFYPVYAHLFHSNAREVPLKKDFRLCLEDYASSPDPILLANPNAPTGLSLSVSEIEAALLQYPDRLMIVDEAYVDFGAESCVPLVSHYDNLLVVQTLSKSRQLAGLRLGLAVGNPDLIADLNRVKNAFNSYNVNRLAILAGKEAFLDREYFEKTRQEIIKTREWTAKELFKREWTGPPSKANFLLVHAHWMEGGVLYEKLREKGILVRHFDSPKLTDYLRITIGTPEEMRTLVHTVDKMKEEAGR